MICDRCGATNTETTLLCDNCGFFLKKLEDIAIDIPQPEQPSASETENGSELAQSSSSETKQGSEFAQPFPSEAENEREELAQSPSNGTERGDELARSSSSAGEQKSELPIDELPTARMPSIPGSPGYAPISLLPFTTEFPLELEQASVTQNPPDDDATLSASPSPLAPPGRGKLALPSRAKTDASSSLSGINAQPDTTTPPGITALSIQPDQREPFAQADQPEPSVKPEQNVYLSQTRQNTPLAQSTQPEQPWQAHQSAQLTQPEQNEQTLQGNPSLLYAQSGQGTPLALEQQMMSQDETRPLLQTAVAAYPMHSWPEEATLALPAGLNTPPSLAGMYAASEQAEMYAASGQLDMGSQAQYGEIGEHPRQSGEPWQGDGSYQASPISERLGNVYPGLPGPAVPGRVANQAGINVFIQPLPRWVLVVGPLAAAALLADLIFANADWATGAVAAALVAIILAILLGIAAGVRIALGMLQETNPRRRSQVISTALLITLLLLFSGIGISQQNSLHMAQGRYLEGQQNWAAAITQYQEAGERSSGAIDVARTYDEWGEAQNRQQQYANAVTQFSTVLQNYPDATNEYNTAKNALITSYLGWANQNAQQQNYSSATAHYDTLLALPFCTTTCKSLTQPKDATAYYQLAEQQLSQHQYMQAVNAYQTLNTRFPQSPEAGQIHAHYAQALWGKGQQEVNTTCSDALSAYRLLTTLFADTSQGKQAATVLKQPVSVKGHFTSTIPGTPFHPTVYLVQGLFVGIQQGQFPSLLVGAPAVPIHSDGSFTFASVPQGRPMS